MKQVESTRRAAEASIAAEVRALNGKCRGERARVAAAFPLHVSVLVRHPPETWEIVVCQMLSDGTPGHFIFQQYHQQILLQGTLVIPVVGLRQAGGRWGVRLPSLVNRAAIYHELRLIHRATQIKITRQVPTDGLEGVPAVIEHARRVELMIPVIDATTGTTGAIRYKDIDGRKVEVEYEEFIRHYRNWSPPRMLP